MNTVTRTLPASLLAIGIVAVGLAGCGSKASDSTSGASSSTTTAASTPATSTVPSATASATSGQASAPGAMVVKGTGYTLQLPNTWRRYTQQGADIQYVSTKPVNTFAENLNVRITPSAPAATVDGAGPELVKELKGVGASNIVQAPDTTVAGEKAAVLVSTFPIGNLKPRMVQDVFIHAGKVYTVTLATPPGTSDAVAQQHMAALMKTWTFDA